MISVLTPGIKPLFGASEPKAAIAVNQGCIAILLCNVHIANQMEANTNKEGLMTTVCHPLNVERYGRKGWFYLTCDDIPGINLFGPDLEELFDSAEIAIFELLKRRGESVARVTIETMPEDGVDSAPVWAVPTQAMALAYAA